MRGRHAQALAALVVAGAALRFATLGVQSYWLDEAATVNLLHKGFGAMIAGVAKGESTPPLYYVLAWVWAKLFGTGEVGLRSLSALFGTATIPLAYVLGRRVGSTAAGLVAAALCAFSPILVWYSQEARSYALLVLLSGLTLLAMMDVLEQPTTRRRALWALACIAALATHYFAGFLIAAEALWLLWRGDARRVAAPIAAVVVAAAALLPLALHQRSTGAAAFIHASSLMRRLVQIPKQFVTGYHGPAEVVLTILAAAVVVLALVLLVRAPRTPARRRAAGFAVIGGAAIAMPWLLGLLGPDYLIVRNVLPAWLPLAVVVAVGLTSTASRRLTVSATTVLCAVGVVLIVAVASNQAYQRDDWRGAAKALGAATQPRAVILTPPSGQVPLALYLKGGGPVPPTGVTVSEIDYVGLAPRLPGEAPHPPRHPGPVPIPGYTEIGRREGPTYTVLRYRTATPVFVSPTVGLNPLNSQPATAIYQP